MDKKKQSILKQEGRIPLQEMGLPDFPDDENTATVTVTKSRRVSFGANFVKEFIVGSAISTQFYSEYEQAFSSSDSSNPNSSQSGLLNQSSCLDNAINLCVKPTVEEEFAQVKKKMCLEKQQNLVNNINEKCNDRNWDFNVSNNSNIFAEKNNIANRSENMKHGTKGIIKPSHNDSFVPGEKYFQSKQVDSEVNSSKFMDNSEKKSKPGKFSSTICFSVDSPTADMEFTEGCISLAKSIFDKKNKEMTVYIQEKKGNEKKEGKSTSGDIIFDGSEVEMSLTKCVHDQSEDDSFLGDKLSGFEGDGSDESHENIENVPMHMYPLNVLLNQNNKSEDDSELERSLFFPERSLTEMLNPEPSKISGFIDQSLEKDDNEECNMKLSVCEPFKICTSNSLSQDKENIQGLAGVPKSEPLKIFLSSNESPLKKEGNDKCKRELSTHQDLKVLASNDISLDGANAGESDMELSICEPLKILEPGNPAVDKNANEESDMDLSVCEPFKIPASDNITVDKHNDEESDMDLSACEPFKIPASDNITEDKHNDEESDMDLSACEPFKIPASDNITVDKHNDEESDMELSACEPFKITAASDSPVNKNVHEESDMELSVSEPLKMAVSSNPAVEKENNQQCTTELSICKPLKTSITNKVSLEEHDNEEGDMMLSAEILKIPATNDTLPEVGNPEECNMELSSNDALETSKYNNCGEEKNNSKDYNVHLSPGECLEISSSREKPLDEDSNGSCKIELPNPMPFELLSHDHHSEENANNEECNMGLYTSEPLQTLASDNPSLDNGNIQERQMELSVCESLKIRMSGTPLLHNDSKEDCNIGLPSSQPSEMLLSSDSARDSDNSEECRAEFSPCGHLKIPPCNDLSVDSDNNGGCNMELSASETFDIFTQKNSGNECNTGDNKEENVKTVEDTKREEDNEIEKSSKDGKHPRCSFLHVDMDVMEDVNKEPEMEACGNDPLSVSISPDDVSLNEDKNEEDAEMTDNSNLKLFTYDRSLRKEGNDDMANCSKDSSFSEVMKEAVDEVNNDSFIRKSVIDLFRSTVTDTDVSVNENHNPSKGRSPPKMQLDVASPVKARNKGKSQRTNKVPEGPGTTEAVSEGDKKIVALLREQSEETNCLWKIESFAHNGDSRCWSFSSSLLGNDVIMKFRLMPPKDMSVVSFSFIVERSIEMLKAKEFQSEKSKTAVEFAFEKMKNYFDPESRGLDNVHRIPLFLDRMNYFLTRINKVVDQLVRIMKEYPGSRLNKSILSFRLCSFPLMFSLSVMVDVNDPLQLSESSVTFEKHFGNFSTTHIKSVFNDCLKSEEVLVQFIRRVIQLIVSEERVRGCITNRSYIRLVT